MSFHVICSTADGNQTKEFSNWEDAHQYANEWMDGFTHWNHRHFNNVESSEYVNLWKTRNGETVKIQEIKSDEIILLPENNAVSNKALAIIKSAVAHHLDTVANNYDAWFAVYDYLPDTNEDCPNCADQASIAAPGQTILCKTHDVEKHFREMKEFFIEEVQRIIFKPALPFCSCCGAKNAPYAGIILTKDGHPLTWSFCLDCRDELTLKQNAARAAQERIGA